MAENKTIFDMNEKELRNALLGKIIEHKEDLKKAVRLINSWQQAYREAADYNEKFLKILNESQEQTESALKIASEWENSCKTLTNINLN